jgi:hypothetical protein
LNVESSEKTDIIRTVFDALPSMVFVVDQDVRIEEYNAAAAEFLSGRRDAVLKRRTGDVLHCIHSTDVPEGCGRSTLCSDCIIRNSVAEAFKGESLVRRRAKLNVLRNGMISEIYALITASPFQFNNRQLVLLVFEDISEIAELRRMIPMCSVCKEIRDEKEAWSRVEVYFKEHWDVDFSHGLCPKCYEIEMEKVKRALERSEEDFN